MACHELSAADRAAYARGGREPAALGALRQLHMLLACEVDLLDSVVRHRRFKGTVDPLALGAALTALVEHNAAALATASSARDVEKLRDAAEPLAPAARAAALVRIAHREELLQWHHLFTRKYGARARAQIAMTRILLPDLAGPACPMCGRTVGLLRCGRCKRVGYCCAAHQKADWMRHKAECAPSRAAALAAAK